MASWYDITGKRINWGDRFTRNLVIVVVVLYFGAKLFLPYFVKPLYDDSESEALTLCLVGAINLILGYFLARNQNQVEERKPES
jgi:uncharacterized membrane-anchored protein